MYNVTVCICSFVVYGTFLQYCILQHCVALYPVASHLQLTLHAEGNMTSSLVG